MSAVLLSALLLGAGPAPSSEYQYGAGAVDVPADIMPVKALGTWHGLVVERGLAPDLVDHRDGVALGDWLNRPHVCSGMVRYHAVIAAEKTVRLYVIAECYGQGTNLDRAAQGLAEEVAKRLGPKATWQNAKVEQAPARLWEVRTFRGNIKPSTP